MLALHVPRPGPRDRVLPTIDQTSPQLVDVPPTISQYEASTLPRYWPASSGTQFFQVTSAPQGGVFTFCRGLPSSGVSSISYSEERARTTAASGPRSTLGQQWSFVHEGPRLELQIRANPHGFLIRIDNKFVSLEPYTSSARVTVMLDFGVSARRRIDIISWGLGFGGIHTGTTDCVVAAELRGPRAIILGDSFTTPQPDNWVSWFAHSMGWDDVWASGAGGTGFVADALGNSLPLPDRVMTDIVPYSPDVVFIHAGLNDLNSNPLAVENAAALTVTRIRQNLPDTLVVGGIDTAFGVEAWSARNLDVMDAIRSGLEAGGAGWLSPLELPFAFGGEPIGNAATIYDTITAGQSGNDGSPDAVSHPNGFTCNTGISTPTANLRVGSTVEIGTGATRERVAITGTGYHHGRLLYAFDGAMQYDHFPGDPVREVGPCFVTGSGSQLAPEGWGSADRFVGLDGFHYSAVGHRALGAVNASLLRHHIRARPLI